VKRAFGIHHAVGGDRDARDPGDLLGAAIDACTGCEGCRDSWQCVIEDDFSGIARRMDEADGVILGSPTYWYSVTSAMKRFVDRCYSLIQYPVSRRQWIGTYQGTGKACVAGRSGSSLTRP